MIHAVKIKCWPVQPIIDYMSDPHLDPGAGEPYLLTGSHCTGMGETYMNRTDDEKK